MRRRFSGCSCRRRCCSGWKCGGYIASCFCRRGKWRFRTTVTLFCDFAFNTGTCWIRQTFSNLSIIENKSSSSPNFVIVTWFHGTSTGKLFDCFQIQSNGINYEIIQRAMKGIMSVTAANFCSSCPILSQFARCFNFSDFLGIHIDNSFSYEKGDECEHLLFTSLNFHNIHLPNINASPSSPIHF